MFWKYVVDYFDQARAYICTTKTNKESDMGLTVAQQTSSLWYGMVLSEIPCYQRIMLP